MIGLPGAGKSTAVSKMVKAGEDFGLRTVVCSTDDFFMEGGVYRFNPGKLTQNHALNFQKFALALADSVDQVIVDNTNIRAEHREPYIKLARAMGYDVVFEVVGEFTPEACETYARRNTHGVPLEGIKRMASAVQLPEEV
jgi:predicted kinase